jgi:hypothetical protein
MSNSLLLFIFGIFSTTETDFYILGVISFSPESLLKSGKSMVVQDSTSHLWFTPVFPDVLAVGDSALK